VLHVLVEEAIGEVVGLVLGFEVGEPAGERLGFAFSHYFGKGFYLKKAQQSLLYYSTITLYYVVNRDVEDV